MEELIKLIATKMMEAVIEHKDDDYIEYDSSDEITFDSDNK